MSVDARSEGDAALVNSCTVALIAQTLAQSGLAVAPGRVFPDPPQAACARPVLYISLSRRRAHVDDRFGPAGNPRLQPPGGSGEAGERLRDGGLPRALRRGRDRLRGLLGTARP